MNSINFTASLVQRSQIMKRQSDNEFRPVTLSIVELDKNDEKDVKALYKTAIDWTYQGAKYSSNIYHEAVKGFEYDNIEKEHYFALTEQQNNFKELDSDKILGLMLFSHTTHENDEISWLQVRPNTKTKDSWNREYKGVGKAMVDLLSRVNYGKPIYVQSSNEAIEFYKKQGFKNSGEDISSCMIKEVNE